MPGKKSPATPASAKKSATKKGTPQKKKPTAATAAAEAAEEKMQEAADEVDYDFSTGDDELDELSRKVKATLQIKSYFYWNRFKGFPYIVWAWTHGNTGITYILIRALLYGPVLKQHIRASIVDEGMAVRIRIYFPDGGEDCNPAHLLKLNGEDADYSKNHPQYIALQNGLCAYTEAVDEEEDEDALKVDIKLPFPVSQTGFVNPLSTDPDDVMSLGQFPLNCAMYSKKQGFPTPSANFLHLHLEELHKPKKKQSVQEKSFFDAGEL